MRNLAIVFLLFSLSANAQIVNKFRDSSWFKAGVRFDSTLVFSKGAGLNKVLTSDANGRATWQTFTASGVTQATLNDTATALNGRINTKASIQNLADSTLLLRGLIPSVSGYATQTALNDTALTLRGIRKVDTIYLNSPNDSMIYLINGIRYGIAKSVLTFTKNSAKDSIILTVSGVRTAVRDSIGVNTDAQTLSVGTNTLTISGGNTVDLNRKVDSSYLFRNSSLDSICLVTIINGISYRRCASDSLPTVSATSTTTFTNKRITARVDSTTSSATPTINTDNVDTYKLTAQAADITSFTTNLSGTPTDDQILHIVIIGTAARAITWGSKFESSTVTLPTTTVSTNRLDVYFIWNTATSKWRCGGVW